MDTHDLCFEQNNQIVILYRHVCVMRRAGYTVMSHLTDRQQSKTLVQSTNVVDMFRSVMGSVNSIFDLPNMVYYLTKEQYLKPCTHDQICIRMQVLHMCKICVRTQIWPCVRIYSRMQYLHVCKSWKICTCPRPSANLILRTRKICAYENLVM